MCDAFRDLGGRTFRCTIPGEHGGSHRGVSGQLSNYWLDGALGAMGQRNPRAADPLPTTVAPDYVAQPYEGTYEEPQPIERIGPAPTPYGEKPFTQLAIPNLNTPAENGDATPRSADYPDGHEPPPVVQPPYVEPYTHDAT